MRRTFYILMLLSLLISACQVTPTPTPTSAPSVIPAQEQAQAEASPTSMPTEPAATATPLPAIPTSPPAELPTSTATQPSASTVNLPSIINTGEAPIIVDHTSVALFDHIPDEYLAAARDLRMMYVDASVGWNINEALNCLASTSWADSPSYCRRDYVPGTWEVKTFGRNELSTSQVPERLLFAPSPTQYDRTQWTFVESRGDWNGLARNFIQTLAPEYVENKDVLSFQFNYQHVAGLTGTSIADPQAGYFADTSQRYDYADLEAFISQHPDKIFFHWTTSLARSIGTQESTDFNNQMRDYVRRNGLILFDVADIESHTPQGEPCYDNRDGVEYCDVNGCENFPDDGLDIPAICQDYTSELEGGHLGSGSIGGLQLAKAFWVLMAQIAGWQP